jgi:heparosan-N-sulfate-glucuronate 5-epimerase
MRSRLPYYRRIAAAYLGGGRSQLSFWHDTPVVNEAAFGPDARPYYMPFREKARYAGPFDAGGIPRLDYRGVIGPQYNPIAIAQYGLGCWNQWCASGDRPSFEKAFLAGEWLAEHLETNAGGKRVWMHHFDWEYFRLLRAPWYSGLAQGQGISLLLRLAADPARGGARFREAAEAAFTALAAPIGEGGCVYRDAAGDDWIEEYLTTPPTHILNGFMWALWGVCDLMRDDTCSAGIRAQAAGLWERSLGTLEKNMARFDTGYWSRYDLAPVRLANPASAFYHRLHLAQLEVMERLTGRPVFAETRARWARYQASALCRKRAFAAKCVFKLVNY